jgi:hypothetical protein
VDSKAFHEFPMSIKENIAIEFYNTDLCHPISVTSQFTAHNKYLVLVVVERVQLNGIKTIIK